MNSKKLNIAVFIGSGLEAGGGFQYEFMVLNILKKYIHNNHNIHIQYYSINKYVTEDYKKLDLEINIIKENIFQKIHRKGLRNLLYFRIFKKLKLSFSKIEKKLQNDNIELIYFLHPSRLSLSMVNIPYIFTLWDLGHLQNMEFPEVAHNKLFESRENFYFESLKKAYRITVDSEFSKNYTIKKYNLDSERLDILNFLPNIRVIDESKYVNIKEKYNLKNDYIFYPAQFWAHKNHIYILKSIKILREEKQIDVDVVFSGSNKGNLNYILKSAKDMGVDDLVHYVGFAPNEEIPHLYKQSLSLVMPTYLGPTNIPPLEAFAYETPVCYSDTKFFREQVGEAVFFIDLKDPDSLVQKIMTIKNNESIVKDKIIKGKEILDNWNDKDFYNKLLEIFNEYKYIRESWR